MIMRAPTPRLLPVTIGVLAGLLAMKSVTLVRLAMSPAPRPDVSLIATVARAANNDSAGPASGHGGSSAAGTSQDAGSHAGAASGQGAAAAKPAAETEAKPAAPPEPPVSASERAVLLELRQRRQELDAREAAIAERESILHAAEQKLGTRIAELQALQGKLEDLEASQRQRDDASWQGLVKLYETMKPRDAAVIFNELAMPVLLQVLDRMKEAKAAAVLAAMNPDKARDVTTELARMRTRSAVTPDATAAKPPASAPPQPRAAGG